MFSESFQEIAFKFRIKNPQMCVIWHIDEIYMRIIQIKMSIRWLYRKKKTNTYEQGLEVLTATSIAFLSRFLFSVFYFFCDSYIQQKIFGILTTLPILRLLKLGSWPLVSLVQRCDWISWIALGCGWFATITNSLICLPINRLN